MDEDLPSGQDSQDGNGEELGEEHDDLGEDGRRLLRLLAKRCLRVFYLES